MDIPVQVKKDLSKTKQIIAMNSFLLKVRNLLYFYTVEPLLWDTSIQGHLHSGDANFGPGKVFTLALYPLPVEGTPLSRGKVPRPRFNLHSRDT